MTSTPGLPDTPSRPPVNDTEGQARDTDQAASSPARPRVSLRVLVGAALVIGMAAGYIAMGRQKALRQAEAIEVVRQAGGRVYLDYQWRDGQPVPEAPPPYAAWLRRLVGDTMLNHAVAVDLRGAQLSVAVARSLLLLPYLHHINAADTVVADDTLALWCRMPGLKSLDLQGTPITDAGMEHLGRLPQLTTLSLARTAVSDRSVPALSRLRRLQQLDLANTAISPEGMRQLRRRNDE